MRERVVKVDTFSVKGVSYETFCPIIALHIESCGHIPPPENGRFAPNYWYLYHTLTKLLIKYLSELVFGVLHFFSPPGFRSGKQYRIASCITILVSPSLLISEDKLRSTY